MSQNIFIPLETLWVFECLFVLNQWYFVCFEVFDGKTDLILDAVKFSFGKAQVSLLNTKKEIMHTS